MTNLGPVPVGSGSTWSATARRQAGYCPLRRACHMPLHCPIACKGGAEAPSPPPPGRHGATEPFARLGFAPSGPRAASSTPVETRARLKPHPRAGSQRELAAAAAAAAAAREEEHARRAEEERRAALEATSTLRELRAQACAPARGLILTSRRGGRDPARALKATRPPLRPSAFRLSNARHRPWVARPGIAVGGPALTGPWSAGSLRGWRWGAEG